MDFSKEKRVREFLILDVDQYIPAAEGALSHNGHEHFNFDFWY